MLVVADIQGGQVDLRRIGGDLRSGDDVVEGHVPLDDHGEHGRAHHRDGDAVGDQRDGQGLGLLGPGVRSCPRTIRTYTVSIDGVAERTRSTRGT